MAGNPEQFGARVVRAPHAGKPAATAPHDRRDHGDGFNVVHCGRAAIQTRASRKWRLHARHAFFALKAFQHRGFFAADVGASAMRQIEVKIPTGFRGVFAQQSGVITFVNRRLQRFALADEFTADINIGCMCPHRKGGNQRPLDQGMRIMAHDFAILAGARLGFIGVDHQIGGPTVRFLGHEGPFQTGREPRPAASAQAG